MSHRVSIGLIQSRCAADIRQNEERAKLQIRQAAEQGAQIICLQELFNARYFPQYVSVTGYDLARSKDDPVLLEMQGLAEELSVVLIVPFYERAARGLYFNSAMVIDADGTELGITRKAHIPDGPQYHEKYYFTPGNTDYPVYQTRYGNIGVAICWDEWFPEVARILALKGAEILFYPSAIGSEPDHPELSTQEAWEKAISAHGISNGVFVSAVNRVGQEDEMSFYGGTFISDPLGKVLARLDDREGILVRDLDLSQIDFARNLLQFLRDRRPETYHTLLEVEALRR